MSTTPSMSIEAGPPTSQADIDQMIERVRAEHPDVKITVNPGPEDALRDATRRYAPEVAEALDAGEVELAAQRLLVRLARLPSSPTLDNDARRVSGPGGHRRVLLRLGDEPTEAEA